MPRHSIRHCQPRIDGGRESLWSACLPAIRDRVQKIADRFGVSPSWVCAQLLADTLSIDFEFRYDNIKPKRKSKAR